MKKFITFILLAFLSIPFIFAASGDNHPADYATNPDKYYMNGNFDWWNITTNVDANGVLKSVTGNRWYNGALVHLEMVTGRTYGYYLVPVDEDVLAKPGVKTYNISYPTAPQDDGKYVYDTTKLFVQKDTYNNDNNAFEISGDIFNGYDVNKDYHLYIWTLENPNSISFESCLTLTKINIKQYLIVDDKQKELASFSTMGISEQSLKTDIFKVKSAVFDKTSTGDLPKVTTNQTYNLYYKHVHETDNNDFSFTSNEACLFAVCSETLCRFHSKPLELKLIPHYEYDLDAIFQPSNATNKNLIWSSDNTSVLTVDQNGFIKGVKAGTTNVTATTTDGSNKTASCTITLQ